MGIYYTIENGKEIKKTMRLDQMNSPAQLSIDIVRAGSQQSTRAPLELNLIHYDPEEEFPYTLTMISPGHYTSLSFDEQDFELAVKNAGLHQHNTYELVYVQEGILNQIIETTRHRYSTGSCFILNRNVRHNEEYTSAFTTLSLSLSSDYFRQTVSEDTENLFPTPHLWNQKSDLGAFLSAELQGEGSHRKSYLDFIPLNLAAPIRADKFYKQMQETLKNPQPGSSYYFRSLICGLLNLLGDRHFFTTRSIDIGTAAESRIFSQINDLIERTNGRISREKLCEELRYSGSYLNRIVQTYTGMNITQYALARSLERAAWMLENTDKTISAIILELGFSNRNFFYEKFQNQYGLTPKEYRKQALQKET